MNNRRKQLMLASAREYCKCVVEGKTIKYNQLLHPSNSSGTFYGLSYTSNESSGTITISGTSNYTSGDPNIYNTFQSNFYLKKNHKYLIHTTSKNFYGWFIDYDSGDILGLGTWNNAIFSPANNANYNCIVRPVNIDIGDFGGKSFNETFYLMLIDLTELGLESITTAEQFLATDIGKYIAKGNYLPYEPNGKFIHAQSPINFDKVKYNQLLETTTFTNIDSPYLLDFFNIKANHKYIFVQKYSRECLYPYEDRDFQVYFYGNNIESEYNINVRGNFIYEPNVDDTCTMSIQTYSEFGTPINFSIMLIDLTELGLDNITSVEDFYKTELGMAIKKGTYLPYTNTNKWLSYTNVFESGLTLYKGDKYKTYSIDEISYNNLIPNANQDYVNSDYDSANANAIVYGANGGVYWAENLTSLGFYNGTFESNTTELVNIYMSGNNTNLYFATDIQMTSGHKYYISFNVTSCIPSFVGGLRIANLRLIDLTELGLTDLTDKLRIFLQKNYKLPYTMTNKTIKDQLVRTFKEVDLSSFTWGSAVGVYYVALPKDIKVNGQAIAERYTNDDIWIAEYPYDDMNLVVITNTTPSGKALLELETPEIITDYPMDFVLSNDNLSYDDSFFNQNGTIFELPNGLIPVLENGIPKLEIIGDELGFVGIEYGNTPYPAQADVYFANGFRMSENQIAFTMTNNDGSNVLKVDERVYLVGKTLRVWVTTPRDIPDIMISRRTINVESDNDINLDFTKE